MEQYKLGDKHVWLEIVSHPFFKHNGKRNEKWVSVRCRCGVTKDVRVGCLRRTSSCGCRGRKLASERVKTMFTTHGQTRNVFFRILRAMVHRCRPENAEEFPGWAGRGISVCDEWHPDVVGWKCAVETFQAWSAANGYKKGLSIDRIDNDLGYSPNNCRYTGRTTQANNTRRNRRFDYNGESRTIGEWAASPLCRVSYQRLRFRLLSGWDFLEAMTADPNTSLNMNKCRRTIPKQP